MNYKKGTDVLPKRLLIEIQEYIDGGLVYIPKKSNKAEWGSLSGARSIIDSRNKQIILMFSRGESFQVIADKFNLEIDTIRKIIYKNK